MARYLWAGAACMAVVLAGTTAWAKSPDTTPSPVSTPAAKPVGTAAPTAAATPAAGSSGLSASVGSSKPSAVSGTAKPSAVSGTAKAEAVSGTAKAEANHKSGVLAHILAIVPGIAFHGVGHIYAGSYMKGFGLMALEGACVGVGYNAVRIAVDNANAQSAAGGIPANISPYLTNGGVALVTGMGFLWTWFDDISGAGIAVDEYNKEQDQAAALGAVQMQVLPAPGGAMLALSSRF